jgi:hypothetical protein
MTNGPEAAAVGGLRVLAAGTLREAVALLNGHEVRSPSTLAPPSATPVGDDRPRRRPRPASASERLNLRATKTDVRARVVGLQTDEPGADGCVAEFAHELAVQPRTQRRSGRFDFERIPVPWAA